MILSGAKIISALAVGDIVIDPFEPGLVNPNSYNYRLGNQLIERRPGETAVHGETLSLTSTGHVLQPGRLYLASTFERIGSRRYVTTLLGRSSLGRLGLFLTATADLGHVGCESNWTLELSVVQPLRIYPGMRVGQIAFWNVIGTNEPYAGRYQSDNAPIPNRDPALTNCELWRRT